MANNEARTVLQGIAVQEMNKQELKRADKERHAQAEAAYAIYVVCVSAWIWVKIMIAWLREACYVKRHALSELLPQKNKKKTRPTRSTAANATTAGTPKDGAKPTTTENT